MIIVKNRSFNALSALCVLFSIFLIEILPKYQNNKTQQKTNNLTHSRFKFSNKKGRKAYLENLQNPLLPDNLRKMYRDYLWMADGKPEGEKPEEWSYWSHDDFKKYRRSFKSYKRDLNFIFSW